MKEADATWEKSYQVVDAAVDRIVDNAASRQTSTVGTSGTTGSAPDSFELTTPVRQDLQVLQQQLQRFHEAAGGRAVSRGTAK
jgi:hypothetical protein